MKASTLLCLLTLAPLNTYAFPIGTWEGPVVENKKVYQPDGTFVSEETFNCVRNLVITDAYIDYSTSGCQKVLGKEEKHLFTIKGTSVLFAGQVVGTILDNSVDVDFDAGTIQDHLVLRLLPSQNVSWSDAAQLKFANATVQLASKGEFTPKQ